MQTINGFLNGGSDIPTNGVAPEAPQDNLGSYTIQSGDTLESIALHLYGDSSLWYLLADANGISDRGAQAGSGEQLHIGQRLTIPPVAIGQHHTNATHKVLNANQMIGNTSATVAAPLPPTPPPLPKKNHGLFAKIVVGVVAAVATVMTAGIMGAIAGVAEGGLFSTGVAVLGGSLKLGLEATLAAGFSAGFIGNIASQGAAKVLGLQEDISFKSALITGLATAASSGLLRGLNASGGYKDFVNTVEQSPLSKAFNVASAATMMEQNALSQSISLALQKHQHFDWEQLAAAGVTAGLMGGTVGKKLDTTLRKVDHNTGMLTTELRSLARAGADSAVSGSQFSAVQVLEDTLGDAIGSALTDKREELGQMHDLGDELYLTDSVLDMIHPERTDEAVYLNYLAQKLSGSDGYESTQSHLTTQQTRHLGSYERLSFDSDLFKSSNEVDNLSFESKVYWNSKERGDMRFVEDSSSHLSSIQFTPKVDKIPLLAEQYFDLIDAENGLRKVYTKYGSDIARIVEKMYRFETKHFRSEQYIPIAIESTGKSF